MSGTEGKGRGGAGQRKARVGVPSTLPPGEPAPADGALPATARDERRAAPAEHLRARAVLHAPAAATATSTPTRRPSSAPSPEPARPATSTPRCAELELAAEVLGPARRPVSTIFVGGGTPTLLPPDDLGRMVGRDRGSFRADRRRGGHHRVQSGVDRRRRAGRLRALGFTRISFGMQSAMPHVLTVLDRVHSPGRPQQAVAEARAAGFAAHQPRPDLRHAGGVDRRLAGQPRRGASPPSRTTSAPTP